VDLERKQIWMNELSKSEQCQWTAMLTSNGFRKKTNMNELSKSEQCQWIVMLTSNDTESRSAYCIGMLINLLKVRGEGGSLSTIFEYFS